MVSLSPELQAEKDDRARKVIQEYIQRNSGDRKCTMRDLAKVLPISKSTIGLDIKRAPELCPSLVSDIEYIVQRNRGRERGNA